MKPPAVGTRIEVTWADCFTVDPWTGYDELLKRTLPEIQTTGYFFGVTEEGCWVLASGLQVQCNEVFGAATWFIPRKMVRSWESTET